MLMGIFILAGYGLAVYGVRDTSARSGGGYRYESTTTEVKESSPGISEVKDEGQGRRAA
jgi:hypothetical protein